MEQRAPLACTRVERQYLFGEAREALDAILSYQERLQEFSRAQERLGQAACDQSHPTEVFGLRPACATAPPLVLLGGMGPLAGADGYARACRRFQNTREIVLFQACFIPDRTAVLMRSAETHGPASPEHQLMIELLESAVSEALSQVETGDGPISLVVLCNTCHFFIPEVLGRLRKHQPGMAARVRFVSLVESTVDVVRRRSHRRIMALYTSGTKLSRIYSRRFDEEDFSYVEPTGAIEQALMHAIFSGVKASNRSAVFEGGAMLFDEILATGEEFDCIIAGCTEVPFILDSLNEAGSERVRAFLERVEVVDPVSAAFDVA